MDYLRLGSHTDEIKVHRAGFYNSLDVPISYENLETYLNDVIDSFTDWMIELTGSDQYFIDENVENAILQQLFPEEDPDDVLFSAIQKQLQKRDAFLDEYRKRVFVESRMIQEQRVFIPPDIKGEILQGNEEAEGYTVRYQERVTMVLMMLEGYGVELSNVRITTGAVDPQGMRTRSYVSIEVPSHEKMILVNEQVGNITFCIDLAEYRAYGTDIYNFIINNMRRYQDVIDTETIHSLSKDDPSLLLCLSKDFLKEVLEVFNNLGTAIIFSQEWINLIAAHVFHDTEKSDITLQDSYPDPDAHWNSVMWRDEETQLENGNVQWRGFWMSEGREHFGTISGIATRLAKLGFSYCTRRILENMSQEGMFEEVKSFSTRTGGRGTSTRVYSFEEIFATLEVRGLLLGTEDGVHFLSNFGDIFISFDDYMHKYHSEIQEGSAEYRRLKIESGSIKSFPFRIPTESGRAKVLKPLTKLRSLPVLYVEETFNLVINGDSDLKLVKIQNKLVLPLEDILELNIQGVGRSAIRGYIEENNLLYHPRGIGALGAHIEFNTLQEAHLFTDFVKYRAGLQTIEEDNVEIDGEMYGSAVFLAELLRCDSRIVNEYTREKKLKTHTVLKQGRPVTLYNVNEITINIPLDPLAELDDQGYIFAHLNQEKLYSIEKILKIMVDNDLVSLGEFSSKDSYFDFARKLVNILLGSNSYKLYRSPITGNSQKMYPIKDFKDAFDLLLGEMRASLTADGYQEPKIIFSGRSRVLTEEGIALVSRSYIERKFKLGHLPNPVTTHVRLHLKRGGEIGYVPLYDESTILEILAERDEFESIKRSYGKILVHKGREVVTLNALARKIARQQRNLKVPAVRHRIQSIQGIESRIIRQRFTVLDLYYAEEIEKFYYEEYGDSVD